MLKMLTNPLAWCGGQPTKRKKVMETNELKQMYEAIKTEYDADPHGTVERRIDDFLRWKKSDANSYGSEGYLVWEDASPMIYIGSVWGPDRYGETYIERDTDANDIMRWWDDVVSCDNYMSICDYDCDNYWCKPILDVSDLEPQVIAVALLIAIDNDIEWDEAKGMSAAELMDAYDGPHNLTYPEDRTYEYYAAMMARDAMEHITRRHTLTNVIDRCDDYEDYAILRNAAVARKMALRAEHVSVSN